MIQFDVAEVKRQLADNDPSLDVNSIADQLRVMSENALNDGSGNLAEGAKSLYNLLELVLVCEQPELRTSVYNFVAGSLDSLGKADDSDDVSRLVVEAGERYSEYSNFLEVESNLPESDYLSEGQWEGSGTDGESDFEVGAAQEQMELLLSAMSEVVSDRPSAETEASDQRVVKLTNEDFPVSGEDELAELMNDEDLQEAFLDDAARGLDVMEKCSLDFEQNPGNPETITQFCRELHTLKGASASVGLSQIASEIHEVETMLETEQANEQIVELMLGVVDKVRGVVERVQLNGRAGPDPTDKNAPPRELMPASFVGSASDDSTIRIRASKLDRLMDMLAELVVLRNRRESHMSELSVFNEELKRCSNRLGYFAQDVGGTGQPVFKSSQTLTEVSKDISDLSDEIRELHSPVRKDNLAISHFIRDFRHELMELRRIPMAGLFNRVQRSARDAAKAEGKQLTFDIEGEDAGLERELQEKLFEPLLHIVRNAVSHGIETPEQRSSHGKETAGKISLRAQSNSQMVVITVQDDGQGLNYEAIRRRGVEKGLIKPDQFLNESELGKLIFHPGFSTREAASAVSGRGVGMDVVMTTVQQMRGRIEIDSAAGQGTSMTIYIPARSGIEHVMVFRAAEQLFALPMQAVANVQHDPAGAQYVSLASALGVNIATSQNSGDVLFLRNSTHSKNRERFGFVIDEILGPEEVVVRKLPPMLQSHPLFSGLTLTGAGETALLLDAERLTKFNQNINATTADVIVRTNETAKANILVVDDSMSARKLLTKKLFAFGFNVVEAADGIEGLSEIRNGQFDLVFTDLDMPRMGGLELLFDLRQGRHKDQRVVVVSSRSADEFRPRALELGAVAYLSKPVDGDELKQLLIELELVD